MEIVEKIHDIFLEEAKKSPILMSDLASMERYISESYTGRSLIELLQNADDACASKLIIKEIRKQVYLVANNGRTFDERDLEVLCRSGASTKHRKNNTIGYRGIGFKSVVNYSNIVHLYSGDIKATFSKMLTQKEIPEAENVPLIRIPHNFEGNEYIKYIYEYLRNEYTTIFIFEVNNNCLLDEIEMFDSSCMLFLRNIKEIIFDSKSRENVFLTRNNQIEDNIKMVQLIGTEDNQNWLVYNDSKNNVTDIAFKYYDNETVMARDNEAVFHSFMPTNNRVNIPLKINGDFSTDPSRTKIVLDTETTDTINNVVELFGKIIEPIWQKKTDIYGIINILGQASLDPLRTIKGNTISDILVEKIIKKSQNIVLLNNINLGGVFLQPQWMTNDDFKIICEINDIVGIGNELELDIKGIMKFAKLIGVHILNIDIILNTMAKNVLSKETRIGVLSEIINRSRLGLEKSTLYNFNNANIISFESGVKSLNDYDCKELVEESFNLAVIEKVDSKSFVEQFYKKMGINYAFKFNDECEDSYKKNNLDLGVKRISKASNVKKWRSVEENTIEILRGFDEIANVLDVAAQNVGYDIEVITKDGTHKYFEVKSVDNIGAPFSMTNNEFSAAVQYKEKYYLAIVNQSDNYIEICFISDPINSLNMTKRVTKWEWYCNSYDGNYTKYIV